tara:strand:+ start:2633 stop:3121 length:489 start_codon:yes stop_codon:yes gene_type:complete
MTAFSKKFLDFLKPLAEEVQQREGKKIEIKQLHYPVAKAELKILPVGSILVFKYALVQIKTHRKIDGSVKWLSGKRSMTKYKKHGRKTSHLEITAMLVEPVSDVTELGNTVISCVNLNPGQITSLDNLENLYNTGQRQPDTYKTYRLGSMYNIKHIRYAEEN